MINTYQRNKYWHKKRQGLCTYGNCQRPTNGQSLCNHHKEKKRLQEKLKNKTNRSLWVGDYDKDGIKNIDDQNPFNKQKKSQVNKEIRLSDAYLNLEKQRRNAAKLARKLSRENKFDSYRVKDTHSIINKLIASRRNSIGDMIGLREETDKRSEARLKWKMFNKKYKREIKKELKEKEEAKKEVVDNKYRSLARTKNPYRAYHTNIKIGGHSVEAQFRTKKQGRINDEMHVHHKQGKSTKKFLRRVKRLIRKGH